MAKGANIKYNIAEFIPCAGFSPICKAVFVQTLHCACAVAVKSKAMAIKIIMLKKFFMSGCKVKGAGLNGNICLTEINYLNC